MAKPRGLNRSHRDQAKAGARGAGRHRAAGPGAIHICRQSAACMYLRPICPCFTTCLFDLGQMRSNFDRCCFECGQFRHRHLIQVRPVRAKLGRSLAEPDQRLPSLAKLDRLGHNLARCSPKYGQIWREFDRIRTILVNVRQALAQIRKNVGASLAQIGRRRAKPGPSIGRGHVSRKRHAGGTRAEGERRRIGTTTTTER